MYSVTFTLQGFTVVRRDGLELSANFTATVNVELAVGAVSETVIVSGESPVVDVQNVTQQRVISREILAVVPGHLRENAFAALTPAAVSPAEMQDVGGSKGEASTRMTIHGSRQRDMRVLLDGMGTNTMSVDGTARQFFINPLASQEIVIEVGSGGSAEYTTGGTQINMIPKDGGNRFDGSFYANYTGHQLQSNNLTDDLRARGLTTPNAVRTIYDVNGAMGGPINKDKLWFYTAHRRWGRTMRSANVFRNVDPASWRYTPDLNAPADLNDVHKSHGIRFTWQANQKHKITGAYDWQNHCLDNSGSALTTNAWEAATALCYDKNHLWQATWTFPATNKLLFEAGMMFARFALNNIPIGGALPDAISVLEQSSNFRYRAAPNFRQRVNQDQANQRFSMSYITGAHHFKVGVFALTSPGKSMHTRFTINQGLNYTFRDGEPISLTQFRSPRNEHAKARPDLGIFIQDQWRIDRLTVNLGLRFDYLRAYVPAVDHPATQFLPAVSYGQLDCVPCWTDINPRVGASFDLFGTGKTALKASVGRYVSGATVDLATANDPIITSVNQVNRAWTDRNRNFVPDCDLRSPDENGECGAMANRNFGQLNVTTRYDPEVLNGWGKRGYNWKVTALIEHELRPGVGVSAGYFRTWYGNFVVTDNLEVAPQDFDPYCITAPANSQLPGGGGHEICGLYDITPTKFGRVNNFVTFASNYGKQTEIYNGVDFNISARVPRGMVSGGVNIGNSASQGGFASTASTSRCFVVDSPQELYQCDVPIAYTSRFKMFGWYLLPWDLQASANFQALPGAPYTARYNATTAEIAPSLGRNLAGGTRTAPIELILPFTQFEKAIVQLDARLSRMFRVGGLSLRTNFDVYNALNANPPLQVNSTYGSSWLTPQEILNARLVKFGVQLDF
jgi:hypothetical protein